MSFEELKKKQSIVWGTGPYERLPEHYAPLLDHLARTAAAREGERILDVGTGTGALASRLARSGAHVTGVDLAPGMIDTAQRLAREAALTIHFEVGDAELLPYEDAEFDVVVSSVGSMFAPDHRAVAQELSRVCRPGGRIALGHWSQDRGVIDMFKVMQPFMPPPPEGAGSPFRWGDQSYVEDLLGTDFDLRFETGDAPQAGDTAEEVWELFSTVYGPTRTLAESLPEDRRSELRRNFIDFYEGFRTPSGVHQSRPYVIATGTRRG